MSASDLIAYLQTLPLFSGLSLAELEDVALMARPFEGSAGDVLFTQGADADGMYVIRSGEVEISARIPGDDSVELAVVGADGVLGEIGLLDGGSRSATAVYRTDTAGLFISRRHFDVMRADRRRGSLVLMNRVGARLAARARRLYDQVRGRIADGAGVSESEPEGQQAFSPGARLSPSDAPFEHLPFFSTLTAPELSQFLDAGDAVRVSRGELVFPQGCSRTGACLVVRGALRTSVYARSRRLHLGVNGPGQFAGVLPLVDDGAQPYAATACEDSLLVHVGVQSAEALRSSDTALSWKLTEALQTTMVKEARQATDVLSRLSLEQQLP